MSYSARPHWLPAPIDWTVFLERNSLLVFLSFLLSCFHFFSVCLFTAEMRSCKYSSKLRGFPSCCPCPSRLCMAFFPACWLPPSFCPCSLSSLHFWFGFWSVVSLSFPEGHRAEAVLSCLSVTERYTRQSPWSAAPINISWFSVCRTWTIIYLLQSGLYTWPYLSLSFFEPRQLSALAELLRIEFMGMEHYYSFCCA